MTHALLRRQLRRAGLSGSEPPSAEGWTRLLAQVADTYAEADQDRYTLERSLTISSAEMQRVYEELRSSSERELEVQRERLRQLDEAGEKLARSEANFKMLVDRSPQPVFVHQGDVFRYVNRALVQMLGYDDDDELLGQSSLEDLVHPDDLPALAAYRAARLAGGQPGSCEMRWRRRDGGFSLVEATSTSITYDGVAATLVIAQDITERTRTREQQTAAQEAVRLSEERYRTLFDSSPVAQWLFDAETFEFLDANEAAVQLYGYSRDEFRRKRVHELKPEMDKSFMVNRVQARRPGEIYTGVHVHKKKNGDVIEVHVTSTDVVVRGRRAMLAFIVDITKTKQLEQQLRQAQKMEAIGQLAGGIAHDFNNILGVILSDAELALEMLPEQHPARESVAEITVATERAATLTKQLLTFSRLTSDQQQNMSLDAAIGNVTKMLSRVLGENVRISTHLDASSSAIVADASQIEQVLLNLSVNARDAMPSGGTLTIATGVARLEETSAATMGLPGGEYLTLTVTDDGCGMSAATQAHIFEPFFTTKAVGKGTGLGLATVFGIVRQSRGAIRVSSQVGRGTTFEIFFPRVASVCESVAPSIKALAARGSERILLVEDDDQLRGSLRRVLVGLGYAVTEAHCADDALGILEEEAARVDLVVTDLVMPGMDGRTMAAEILRGRPGTRFLYMSGYTEHVAMKGAPIGADDHFMHKPFTPHELAAAVRQALTNSRARTSRPVRPSVNAPATSKAMARDERRGT